MSIAIEVEDEAWTRALPEAGAVVERAAKAALIPDATAADVTVLLTDDETIRELNGRFRGKDTPTNVLSFPSPEFVRPHLGDIALAYGVCAAEAEAQGKTLSDHLSHLTVHGVLHLLGWDHEVEAEASAMEDMERRILHALGVSDPYGQDADG